MLATAIIALILAANIGSACFDPKQCPDPAAVVTFAKFSAPFNAPVRFGGQYPSGRSGLVRWVWIKAGEPPQPCTDTERTRLAVYKHNPCDAKVGDDLMMLVPTKIAK